MVPALDDFYAAIQDSIDETILFVTPLAMPSTIQIAQEFILSATIIAVAFDITDERMNFPDHTLVFLLKRYIIISCFLVPTYYHLLLSASVGS